MNWQTLTAAGIVAFTAALFLIRLLRPQKNRGCDHGCGCGRKPR